MCRVHVKKKKKNCEILSTFCHFQKLAGMVLKLTHFGFMDFLFQLSKSLLVKIIF